MRAIFKREFSSYMHNVTGLLFIAAIVLFEGFFLMADNLIGQSPNFEDSWANLQIVLIFAVPVLAMRSLAEDKRSRVDQLLYSLPLPLWQVVLGKYLAMVAIFGVACGIIALYPLILCAFGTVSFAAPYCSLIAFFLLGSALLALCMFLSSLTESQIIAAVVGVGGVLLLNLMDSLALIVPSGAMPSLVALLIVAALLLVLLGLLTKPKSYDRFLIQAEACLTHDAYESLNHIKAPTVVIGGEKDLSLGGDASKEIAAKIPGAELQMYAQWGHGLYEEAKDFNQVVLDFLRR